MIWSWPRPQYPQSLIDIIIIIFHACSHSAPANIVRSVAHDQVRKFSTGEVDGRRPSQINGSDSIDPLHADDRATLSANRNYCDADPFNWNELSCNGLPGSILDDAWLPVGIGERRFKPVRLPSTVPLLRVPTRQGFVRLSAGHQSRHRGASPQLWNTCRHFA